MVQVMSYKEVISLLRQEMPLRIRALLAFQYASGCRIGELLEYKHKDGTITKGLLKSNIKIGEDTISWEMPNFKVKKEKKKIKSPFILKEETFLWQIATEWLTQCGEQIFELKQSRARGLVKEKLSPHSSHTLRRSRGTHLAETFGYNVYEIMDTLGHTKMESGLAYVSTAQRKQKMKERLLKLKEGGLFDDSKIDNT